MMIKLEIFLLVRWENPGEFFCWFGIYPVARFLLVQTVCGGILLIFCRKFKLHDSVWQISQFDLKDLTVIRLPWGITIMIIVAWVKFPGRTRVGWKIGMVHRWAQNELDLLVDKSKVLRLDGDMQICTFR